MTILDTNVLSGLMLASPDLVLVQWLDRQVRIATWTTAVSVFEIRSGIERLPEGRRRLFLQAAFDRVLADKLQGRILPFDHAAADEAGRREADRLRRGFTDDVRDIQIAGIVIARRATLATRNVRDVSRLELVWWPGLRPAFRLE